MISETSDQQTRCRGESWPSPLVAWAGGPRATGRSSARACWLGCALLLLAAGCSTRSLHLREWSEGRTAHFEIVSSLGEDETVRLARDLEYFRTAAGFVLGRPLADPPVPTRVYAFDGRGFSRPFAVGGQPGSFRTTLRGATIVLRRDRGWRGDATPDVRHDFVHYLYRNRDGLERPLWHDEGVAQFSSTIDSSPGGATIGRPRDDFVHALRDRLGLSAEWVVGRRDRLGMGEREAELFDATSWAMVHVLVEMSGRGNPSRFRSRSKRYMALVQRGVAPGDALASAFETSMEDVDARLEEHVREDAFRGVTIRSEQARRGAEVELRPLSLVETLDHLGWLAIDYQRAGHARRYFELALKESPDEARALAGRCAALRIDGRLEEALPDCERAVSLAPGERRAWLALGRLHHAKAAEAAEASRRRRGAALAREAFGRGLEIDADSADVHALLGSTYLIEGEEHALGIPYLDRAEQILPSSLEIALLKAELHLTLGHSAQANYFAVLVESRSHSSQLSRRAREIINETAR